MCDAWCLHSVCVVFAWCLRGVCVLLYVVCYVLHDLLHTYKQVIILVSMCIVLIGRLIIPVL